MATRAVAEATVAAFLDAGQFTHMSAVQTYLKEVLDLRTERVIQYPFNEILSIVRVTSRVPPPRTPNDPHPNDDPERKVTITDYDARLSAIVKNREQDGYLSDQIWLGETCVALVGYLEALAHAGALTVQKIVYYGERAGAGVPLLKVELNADVNVVMYMDAARPFTVWQTHPTPDGGRTSSVCKTWPAVIDCIGRWLLFELK